ncbi:hypothetical protein PI125_g23373 [Phytophthora idaei]|nr:hypothetical protein PI125_g23373 [Phytophthora idaei]KAG3123493.1 hypothetical protein PI126_g23680 [Phytophthora idaei]
MPGASDIASRFGATSPPNLIPLYVYRAINDDAEAAAQMTNQRRDYYIGLFHELGWHASKKTSRKSKAPEWVALCQSWNAFVENFNKDAKAYRARITAAQRRFETFSRRDRTVSLGLSVSLSETSPGTRLYVYLFSCAISAFNLNVVTLRVSAVIRSPRAGVTPALRFELRTPSPFPERPPSGRAAVPIYIGEEEILSNEYEDELDLGSASGGS